MLILQFSLIVKFNILISLILLGFKVIVQIKHSTYNLEYFLNIKRTYITILYNFILTIILFYYVFPVHSIITTVQNLIARAIIAESIYLKTLSSHVIRPRESLGDLCHVHRPVSVPFHDFLFYRCLRVNYFL